MCYVYITHNSLVFNMNYVFCYFQAYSGSQKVDDKEKILWMRFERSDINGKNNLYYTV